MAIAHRHADSRRPARGDRHGLDSVMIGFLPAARMGDPTAHGGTIVLGELRLMIGG